MSSRKLARIWGAFRKEPIAAASLLVSLVVGALGSPILIDWYSRPDVVVTGDYRNRGDARCAPFRLTIQNKGRRSALNVDVQYDVDYFTSRGDVTGYYSGDEPLFNVKKNLDYESDQGKINIPRLLPGQEQTFVYVETVNDADGERIRQKQIADNQEAVRRFPKITLITYDNGIGRYHMINGGCLKDH